MPAKILVVEDDAGTRRLLEFTLRQAGFKVVLAQDGIESVQVAQNEYPDAIIMDVGLPCMGGYEACSRLRTSPTTAHIPILILTARVQAGEQALSVRAGANDFLTKPVELDVIVAHVEKLLDRWGWRA